MADGRYVPRISIEVSKELHAKIQKHIPWGSMRPVMAAILESVVELIESKGVENRNIIIGALVSGKISIIDMLRACEESKSK